MCLVGFLVSNEDYEEISLKDGNGLLGTAAGISVYIFTYNLRQQRLRVIRKSTIFKNVHYAVSLYAHHNPCLTHTW